MKKKSFWMLLAALIAVWAVGIWAYWDTIVMYIAPQVPIQAAFGEVCDSIESWYQESPIPIVLRGYDEGGRQTARMDLRTPDGAEGTAAIQVRLKTNEIFLEGTFPRKPALGKVGLYLNKEQAAMTSETLLDSGYYGITYDTFGQDLMSGIQSLESLSSYVTWFLPQPQAAKIQEALDDLRTSAGKLDDSVQGLQEKMSWKIDPPAIPNVDMEAVKQFPLALLALRGKTTFCELEVNDESLPCYQVVFKLEGENAKFIWGLISQEPFPENGRVQLTCWMSQKSLVQLKVDASAAGRHISCTLGLGDALTLSVVTTSGVNIHFSTQKEGEWEATSFYGIRYDWNAKNGDLILKLANREAVKLNLTEAENGFRIESTQLDTLLKEEVFSGCSCSAVITKGAEFTPPEIKELKDWSAQDLLLFLNGVWNGIKPK